MFTPLQFSSLKRFLALLIFIFSVNGSSLAQIYNMSNGTINTCAGTFYDSGGAGGNYANNSNIVQTFCSNAGAGSCFQVQFTAFNTRNSADYLNIYDGPNIASPLIGTYFGNIGAFNLPILSSTGCLTFQFISNGSQNRAGWAANIVCVPCPPTPGGGSILQHPTVGLQNTFIGACMQNECNATYYDNGGASVNYSNNINGVYWTICPNTAGNCVRAIFHSFDVEPPGFFFYDYLTIGNGPTQNSPEFGTGSTWAGACPDYQTCMGAGLGPYISSDQSGCLTFRFTSDFSVTRPGWVTSIDCVPCANGPTGLSNADCSGITPICSNTPFASVSSGPGLVSEGCAGCNQSENYSNWFAFRAQTNGIIQMTVNPVDVNDDYDFAMYGPNNTCLSLGAPIRCSYASNTGNTGTNGTAVDVSEDVTGDGWVSNLNVNAGETYMLMINKWTPGGSGYTIDWTGSTASLDCSILPVELLSFQAIEERGKVNLTWSTASEISSDRFIIERAGEDLNFEYLLDVDAAGTSTSIREYQAMDHDPPLGKVYYKLLELDVDGNYDELGIAAVELNQSKQLEILNIISMENGSLNITFNSPANEPVSIAVMTAHGASVYSEMISTIPGKNEVNLPIGDQAGGLYFLSITKSDSRISSKFMLHTQ